MVDLWPRFWGSRAGRCGGGDGDGEVHCEVGIDLQLVPKFRETEQDILACMGLFGYLASCSLGSEHSQGKPSLTKLEQMGLFGCLHNFSLVNIRGCLVAVKDMGCIGVVM